MKIYKVEQGNIYEGAYQSFYYLKYEDANKKAIEMRQEHLDDVLDHITRMGIDANPYKEPFKIQNQDYWIAGQEYLEILEIEAL